MEELHNKIQENADNISIEEMLSSRFTVDTFLGRLTTLPLGIKGGNYVFDYNQTYFYGDAPFLWFNTYVFPVQKLELVFTLDIKGMLRVKRAGFMDMPMEDVAKVKTTDEAIEKINELVPVYRAYYKLVCDK